MFLKYILMFLNRSDDVMVNQNSLSKNLMRIKHAEVVSLSSIKFT